MTSREERAALACAPDPGPRIPGPAFCASFRGECFLRRFAPCAALCGGGAAGAGSTKPLAYPSCLAPRDRFSHFLTFSRPFFSRPLFTRHAMRLDALRLMRMLAPFR